MHIGVLTGGGDCPGLNAAIRAVTLASAARGWTVTGLRDGWAGVLNRDGLPLTAANTDVYLSVGGTMLGSSRTNPLRAPADYARTVSVFDDMQMQGLVAIGGDDTLSVAGALAGAGLPVVGVPKTIDNDVPETDASIGFDTAVETVAGSVARLRTTTTSHHRVTVVETMGRQAGWLAAMGGLAGGADFIAVPERRSKLDDFIAHVRDRYDQGTDFSIIVTAESAVIEGLEVERAAAQTGDQFGHVVLSTRSIGDRLGYAIEEATGIETRTSVLGHLQRGGAPTAFDRVLGTRMGAAAVDYLEAGSHGQLAALHGARIDPVPLADIAGKTRALDDSYLRLLHLFA